LQVATEAAGRQNVDTKSGRSLVLQCEVATWVRDQEVYAADNCAVLVASKNHAMHINPISNDFSPTLRKTCPRAVPQLYKYLLTPGKYEEEFRNCRVIGTSPPLHFALFQVRFVVQKAD
jgi:hypothetical protein